MPASQGPVFGYCTDYITRLRKCNSCRYPEVTRRTLEAGFLSLAAHQDHQGAAALAARLALLLPAWLGASSVDSGYMRCHRHRGITYGLYVAALSLHQSHVLLSRTACHVQLMTSSCTSISQ